LYVRCLHGQGKFNTHWWRFRIRHLPRITQSQSRIVYRAELVSGLRPCFGGSDIPCPIIDLAVSFWPLAASVGQSAPLPGWYESGTLSAASEVSDIGAKQGRQPNCGWRTHRSRVQSTASTYGYDRCRSRRPKHRANQQVDSVTSGQEGRPYIRVVRTLYHTVVLSDTDLNISQQNFYCHTQSEVCHHQRCKDCQCIVRRSTKLSAC
jgi:hypothetical protein